jgi:hypothetical protein
VDSGTVYEGPRGFLEVYGDDGAITSDGDTFGVWASARATIASGAPGTTASGDQPPRRPTTYHVSIAPLPLTSIVPRAVQTKSSFNRS